MIEQDRKRITALKYAVENKSGIASELIKEIGEDYAEEFHSLHFIGYGWTEHFKTWHITKLGIEYYERTKIEE